MAAVTGICVAARSPRIEDTRSVRVGPGSDESLLLAALDELICALDTSPEVPVGAAVRNDGGDIEVHLDLDFHLAAPASVEPTGAGPKAISRSGLRVDASPGEMRCSFFVDV